MISFDEQEFLIFNKSILSTFFFHCGKDHEEYNNK